MRFIGSIILVAVAVGGFFLFTNPLYEDMQALKEESASLNEALENARRLREVQDDLLAQYNTFSDDDLERLSVMVPDSANNIRLIIEIEKLALTHDVQLNDVSFDPPAEESEEGDGFVGGGNGSGTVVDESRDYGTLAMSFVAEGQYHDFMNFMRSLERSLRIVDVTNLSFTSAELSADDDQTGENATAVDRYQYQFTINTYWLRSN